MHNEMFLLQYTYIYISSCVCWVEKKWNAKSVKLSFVMLYMALGIKLAYIFYITYRYIFMYVQEHTFAPGI